MHQPRPSEQILSERKVQDGRRSGGKGPDQTGRVDDQNRLQVGLFSGPSSPLSSGPPPLRSQRYPLPVLLSPFWAEQRSPLLHKSNEVCFEAFERERNRDCILPRRPALLSRPGPPSCSVPQRSNTQPLHEVGLAAEYQEVGALSHEVHRLSGSSLGLLENAGFPSPDQDRSPDVLSFPDHERTEGFQTDPFFGPRSNSSFFRSDFSPEAVLAESATRAEKSQRFLGFISIYHREGARRSLLLVLSPPPLEWEISSSIPTICSNLYRCLQLWLGCIPSFRRCGDLAFLWLLFRRAAFPPYKPERATHCFSCGEVGPREIQRPDDRSPPGQHGSHLIYQWERRPDPRSLSNCRGLVESDLVPGFEHFCSAYFGRPECSRGCSFADGGSIRPSYPTVLLRRGYLFTVASDGGCLRIIFIKEAPSLLVPPSGPCSREGGRSSHLLEGRAPLPLSTGETCSALSQQVDPRGSGSSVGSSIQHFLLDSPSAEMQLLGRGRVNPNSCLNVPSRPFFSSQSVWDEGLGHSRLEVIRAAPSYSSLSEESWDLVSASWASQSSMNSHWKNYVIWARENNVSPLSGNVSHPLNFLTDCALSLQERGKQPQSAIPARSAINSVWRVYGLPDLGEDEIVSRTFRGINRRFPQPRRYSTTFFAGKVLDTLKNLGSVKSLPFLEATRKTAALVAIVSGGRPKDLEWIQTNSMTVTSKGHVVFSCIPKNQHSRALRGRFFMKFPNTPTWGDESPARVVRDYHERANSVAALSSGKSNRDWFFLASKSSRDGFKKAHVDTIKRYLRQTLEAAGVSDSFTAHSFKHSLVSSLKLRGASRETVSRVCRTSAATLLDFYDHSDTFLEAPRCSQYAIEVLDAIIEVNSIQAEVAPPQSATPSCPTLA